MKNSNVYRTATNAVSIGLIAAALVAGSGVSAGAWSPPARKDCYEGFSKAEGCPWKGYLPERELRPLSCENLVHMRNRIYAQGGYCFQKPALKKQYNADGCKWPLQALVPLNKYERANILTIKSVERAKRCS